MVYDVITQTSCGQDHKLRDQGQGKKFSNQDEVNTETKMFARTTKLTQLKKDDEDNTRRVEGIVHVTLNVIITTRITLGISCHYSTVLWSRLQVKRPWPKQKKQ